MKAPVLEPTSAAKSGWVIILLTVGWMGFMLWPWPKDKPAAKPAAIPVPATSLTRSGLAEYTDWEGLPEIFAIWADKAEWKDGKTRFAYWHPVMKNYSYFFEATRVGAGYRFQEMPEPREYPDGFWDESLGEDCPIRFYHSLPAPLKIVLPQLIHSDPAGSDPIKVKLDIDPPTLRPEMKNASPKAAPKP